MDHKPSNPETNSWVDDRMAKLDPAAEWNPDADRALDLLTQGKPSENLQWMRVAMTATILAATILVLVMLPWQRLWTPKPVAMVAAQTQTTPAEKPAEKAQERTPAKETPAPTQAAETAPQAEVPQAPATPTPETFDVLHKLPDNEEDLAQYLARLGQPRSQVVTAIQTPQSDSSEPQIVRSMLPEYSDQARQARIQGTVEMVITVKADGTVQFESFKKILGYGLDEKAREAVEQWVFTPAKKDGVPVAKTVTVSTNFSLR